MQPCSQVYFIFLFLCLPPGIAPLCPDQRIGFCLPHQWGGSNCQRFGAYFFRFVRSFHHSGIASSLRLMSPSSYFPILFLNVEHYILRELIFLFHAQKFQSFVGSRTWVLLFHNPMFFHCTSRPRQPCLLIHNDLAWMGLTVTWVSFYLTKK